MRLLELLKQVRLMQHEQAVYLAIEKHLTGDIEADEGKYLTIAGEAIVKAWREGLEAGMAAKGIEYKFHSVPPRILGNLDGRLSLVWKEASGVLVIRLEANSEPKMVEKAITEYGNRLRSGIRAAMQDAANAGYIYASGLKDGE